MPEINPSKYIIICCISIIITWGSLIIERCYDAVLKTLFLCHVSLHTCPDFIEKRFSTTRLCLLLNKLLWLRCNATC